MEEQFTGLVERLVEQMRAQIDAQLKAITDQFARMGGLNSRRLQPHLRFTEEDDKYNIGSEPVNLFARRGAQRGSPMCKLMLIGGRWNSSSTFQNSKVACNQKKSLIG